MKSLKRIMALVIFLTAAFIGSAIYLNIMLDRTANKICLSIDAAENYIKSGNWQEAERELESLNKSWEEIRDKWIISVEHAEVDEISLMLCKLTEFAKAEELPSALAEAAAMRELVKSVPDKDSFKLKNIL
ncbi:MAG: DUF4363 family protein [Eubacteriales bacterium]|nr:DUF4363 family protein [Eubacteriales bacterium]